MTSPAAAARDRRFDLGYAFAGSWLERCTEPFDADRSAIVVSVDDADMHARVEQLSDIGLDLAPAGDGRVMLVALLGCTFATFTLTPIDWHRCRAFVRGALDTLAPPQADCASRVIVTTPGLTRAHVSPLQEYQASLADKGDAESRLILAQIKRSDDSPLRFVLYPAPCLPYVASATYQRGAWALVPNADPLSLRPRAVAERLFS